MMNNLKILEKILPSKKKDESAPKWIENVQENIRKKKRQQVVFFYGDEEVAWGRYNFKISEKWDEFQRDIQTLSDLRLQKLTHDDEASTSGLKNGVTVRPWSKKNVTRNEFLEIIMDQTLEEVQAKFDQLMLEGKQEEAVLLSERCQRFEYKIRRGLIPLENFGYVAPKPPASKGIITKTVNAYKEDILRQKLELEKRAISELLFVETMRGDGFSPRGEVEQGGRPEKAKDKMPEGSSGQDKMPEGNAGQDKMPEGNAGQDKMPEGSSGKVDVQKASVLIRYNKGVLEVQLKRVFMSFLTQDC